MASMEAVLSIAGSDSSGGAGIQADIKTIAALGLFAETAVTALTAQNTTGVFGVLDVDPAFVAQQIDVVFEDIRPAAVKVGMVSSAAIVAAIAEALARNHAENVVVDPGHGGHERREAHFGRCRGHARREAVPAGDGRDAEPAGGGCALRLSSWKGRATSSARRRPSRLLGGGKTAVLVKGGHGARADDLLRLPDGTTTWLRGERIETANTHGTGCTLSSAIACGLARGLPLAEAVRAARGLRLRSAGRRARPGAWIGPARPWLPGPALARPVGSSPALAHGPGSGEAGCPRRASPPVRAGEQGVHARLPAGCRKRRLRSALACAGAQVFEISGIGGLTRRNVARNIFTRACVLLRQGAHRAADGVSSNGRTAVSGAVCEGSTPSTPAIFTVYCTAHHVAPSSSGLGRRPLKAEVAGSNPVGATKETTGRGRTPPAFLSSPCPCARLRTGASGGLAAAAKTPARQRRWSKPSENPTFTCRASQKGLLRDAPQRQSA